MYAIFLLMTVVLAACSTEGSNQNQAPQGFESLAALGTNGNPPEELTATWNPVNDPSVQGYRLYLGIESGHYLENGDVGNVTTYRITVPNGFTWYFAVTAYNGAGESALSEEASITLPR